MDLLLGLIEDRKLDITRISLAEVTDQYLDFIKGAEKISLENLADFLSVAAKLILIKSKALLPSLELDEEEEEEIKDLEIQLKEYRKFKEAAGKMGALFSQAKPSFSRESFLELTPSFCAPKNVDLALLKKSFENLLREIPDKEKLEEEVVSEVVTLEEKIEHLLACLRQKVELSFGKLVSGAQDKTEVIVSFLALLELVKQCLVSVNQDSMFSDIKFKTAT